MFEQVVAGGQPGESRVDCRFDDRMLKKFDQFIYNAVAQNCVEVATHRHGCCVLQRCVDHASDHQRVQLVQEITYNALTLVQDPYGNYVGVLSSLCGILVS